MRRNIPNSAIRPNGSFRVIKNNFYTTLKVNKKIPRDSLSKGGFKKLCSENRLLENKVKAVILYPELGSL